MRKLRPLFVFISLIIPNNSLSYTFKEDDLSPEDFIQGDIQVPEIPSFIQRANVRLDYSLSLEKDLLQEIINSVQNKPF